MSIYTYQNSKIIDQVTFKTTANGAVRAYVHAAAGVGSQTLNHIMDALRTAGCETIPFTLDDKPTIEVRGLKRESQFIKLFADNKWIDDKPHIEKQVEKTSIIDWIRKRSLQLSGFAMGLADLGFIIYGFKEAKLHKMMDPKHTPLFDEALAGFCYLGGSTVLSAYGRNDQSDLQVRDLAKMILKNAQERGLLTEKTAADSLGAERKETLITKVDNFFRTHPSEIGNMMYFSAGALIARSALFNRAIAKPRPGMTAEQIQKQRFGGWFDTALGTTTMASGSLATFAKEKAEDPDAPKKTGFSYWFDWLKRRPLAMASMGYAGSSLCHAMTTYVDRKEAIRASTDMSLTATERKFATEKKGAVKFRVAFIICTLIGEFLLAISSKGHGDGVVSDNSVDNSAIAIMADLIVKQPRHLQDDLIEQMSTFLGKPEVLAMKDQEVVELLRKQVETLRTNPWAIAEGADCEVIPSEPATTIMPAQEKPAIAAWQAKLNAATQQAAQLHTRA